MRTFLWFALGSAGLILIAAISVVASNGQINTAADDRSVARIAAIALVFGLIGGIVVMAGEITHGTVTQSLLVTPVRERVLLAKVAIAGSDLAVPRCGRRAPRACDHGARRIARPSQQPSRLARHPDCGTARRCSRRRLRRHRAEPGQRHRHQPRLAPDRREHRDRHEPVGREVHAGPGVRRARLG